MLRRTLTALRVSPYCIFLQDLAKRNELSGIPLREGKTIASRMYRSLTPAQLRSLQARANKLTYPALDAFNRFQRQHAFLLTHLSNSQRQRIIGKMWKKLRESRPKSYQRMAVRLAKKKLKLQKVRKTVTKTTPKKKKQQQPKQEVNKKKKKTRKTSKIANVKGEKAKRTTTTKKVLRVAKGTGRKAGEKPRIPQRR